MEQLIRVQLEQNKYQVAPDWREVAELVQELHWLERERTDTPTNGTNWIHFVKHTCLSNLSNICLLQNIN